MTESLLATLQQWLLFSGAVVVVGCVAWRLLVAPRASRAVPPTQASEFRRIERGTATFGILGGVVLFVAWALRMVVQVMGFRDPFVPLWEDVSFLLFETFWGTVWMAQGAALPLLLAAFGFARAGARARGGASASSGEPMSSSSAAWSAAAVLALGIVATLSLSSHAMGVDSWKPAIVTVDAVHALAAGCWIGALTVILTVGRSARVSGDGAGVFAAQLQAFSPMAIACVAALITMGTLLAWTHLVAVSDLWSTGYGRVLSAKVALAGGVFLAGLLNWRRGLLVCDTTEGAAAVHRRAALEVALAFGVLLLTAVLVHSVKP